MQVHVTDRDQFRPVDAALHLLATAQHNYPDQFKFLKNRGRYFFDLLAGTDELRLEAQQARIPYGNRPVLGSRGKRSSLSRCGPYLLYD